MSKHDTITESTIARIAGNLLSGKEICTVELGSIADKHERKTVIREAVAFARAIAAEVVRTRPQPDTEGTK
jgi:hypothetical protein